MQRVDAYETVDSKYRQHGENVRLDEAFNQKKNKSLRSNENQVWINFFWVFLKENLCMKISKLENWVCWFTWWTPITKTIDIMRATYRNKSWNTPLYSFTEMNLNDNLKLHKTSKTFPTIFFINQLEIRKDLQREKSAQNCIQ